VLLYYSEKKTSSGYGEQFSYSRAAENIKRNLFRKPTLHDEEVLQLYKHNSEVTKPKTPLSIV